MFAATDMSPASRHHALRPKSSDNARDAFGIPDGTLGENLQVGNAALIKCAVQEEMPRCPPARML
jgi:hypothetical protein